MLPHISKVARYWLQFFFNNNNNYYLLSRSASNHIPDQHLLPCSLGSDVFHRWEEGGSDVCRSSHHLWNFRAGPHWKRVLCPPLKRNALALVVREKCLIWPGIWRHFEKCKGGFSGVRMGGLRPTERPSWGKNNRFFQLLEQVFLLWF